MIELTQIEIEIGYGDDLEIIEITRGEVIELITRLREAERDAARYRYIKSVCEVIECADGWYLDVLDGQDLDTMVDDCIEAMKESGDE